MDFRLWFLRCSALTALALGATATAAEDLKVAGYRGIPWGAPCSDAIERIKAEGAEFARSSDLEVDGPLEPRILVPGELCSLDPMFRFLPGKQGYRVAWGKVGGLRNAGAGEKNLGSMDVFVMCREGRFVAIKLRASRQEDIATIERTQGQILETRDIGRRLRVSVLEPRNGSRRFVSSEPTPVAIRMVNYLVLSETEYSVLQGGERACRAQVAALREKQNAASRILVE